VFMQSYRLLIYKEPGRSSTAIAVVAG
jgi:hypothetical protein